MSDLDVSVPVDTGGPVPVDVGLTPITVVIPNGRTYAFPPRYKGHAPAQPCVVECPACMVLTRDWLASNRPAVAV